MAALTDRADGGGPRRGSIREQDYGPLADEFISAAVGATVINLMYPDGDRIADYESYIDRFLARLR